MFEFFVIIGIIILFRYLLTEQESTSTVAEEVKNNPSSNGSGIVGKSTFVLNANKNIISSTDKSGKLDIEVPLDYDEDDELLEELEELSVSNQSTADITFDEMMEVVKDVETEQPKKPEHTGKMLYLNENTDWVAQLAATSENYQKRISVLIDLHMENIEQNIASDTDNGISGFDIAQYI